MTDRYFIVVGRSHGDDEATAEIISASTRGEAVACYQARLRNRNGLDYSAEPPDEGFGAVYIDTVFDCGNYRPDEV